MQVCRVTRRVMYLGAVEQRRRASGVGNTEGVPWEGVQDSPGIVEEFECLVTGVENCCGDLQVLQSVDIDVGGRGLDGQAGGSKDGDRRGDEDDEGSTEGAGHR